MNALNQHKTEILNEVIGNGCTIPSKILETYLDTLILLAKTDQQIEDNQVYLNRIGDWITEPESLKPEDLINGEWYVFTDENKDWVMKFTELKNKGEKIWGSKSANNHYKDSYSGFLYSKSIKAIRKATKEEVLKYFPDEFKEIEPSTDHPNTI
jgi:hypothetical protein